MANNFKINSRVVDTETGETGTIVDLGDWMVRVRFDTYGHPVWLKSSRLTADTTLADFRRAQEE